MVLPVPLKKILILRFSAMGDVALLVPVVRSAVSSHPDIEITIVTRPKFAPLFYGIDRVVVFPADVDRTYKGVSGLLTLFQHLKKNAAYDVILDMHDHLRTLLLRTLFRMTGRKVVVFDKGRCEKKAFTRKKGKVVQPLPHTVERYRMAFEQAGFSMALLPPPYIIPADITAESLPGVNVGEKQQKKEKWIGLAPFSRHASKIWPVENYPQVIDEILRQLPARFFLFGGGQEELRYFEKLKQQFPESVEVVAGKLNLRQEIALIQQLDLMVCVDSSNLHFAVLAGTPLLSIWGGTHPDVGFGPFGRGNESIIQVSRHELPCRPCSVYGKETCYLGGFPCLNLIPAKAVANRVVERINTAG